MRISKSLLLAASAAYLAFASGPSAAETLTIASEGAYPPFNVLQTDGTMTGFDIDIAKAVCDEMKVECKIVSQEWDGAIPALDAGKFDAYVASMSITDERKQKVDFSAKYYNTPPAIVVAKDSDLTDATEETLSGKTLGAQSSTSHSNYVEKHFSKSELKLYPTSDEYKLDLSNGRIDGIVDDIVVLSEWLKTPDGEACCKLLKVLPVDPIINGNGAGIAVKKGNTALAERFTKAIAALRENGKYKEINDKYFSFDAYGE
ncbi:transporter substrate-binding domain-containing protein [Rhizobium sp. CFBP 8762]|uniref:transporter substrate-binding domain-containing protein n=1 Tax=Rhizobium sp. CFBP 8762 TaxID=2775279 RepID=UPI001781CA5B|nr:transporter substrate-binding domain-containing protein [Rhizobium sp. CFBP 8762]MBD8555846.1 transporter substrate-binding domain-containing protein [Rhizobium sp. CFBP 8762]